MPKLYTPRPCLLCRTMTHEAVAIVRNNLVWIGPLCVLCMGEHEGAKLAAVTRADAAMQAVLLERGIVAYVATGAGGIDASV